MPDYKVTVVNDPASALDTAVQWSQIALTKVISKQNLQLNNAITEGIRNLQLALRLLDNDANTP